MIHTKVVREVFNFKNSECRQNFFEVTSNTNRFTACFEGGNENFAKQSKKFFKTLNGTFYECFRKVRITNKSRKLQNDEIQQMLQLKDKLVNFRLSAKSPFSKSYIQKKIDKLEDSISRLISSKNAANVREQVKEIETLDGKFSQNGMWKVNSRLFPRPRDPAMAKKDKFGNLVTSEGPLRDLYLQTYVQRLENRKMKEEFQEMFTLKTVLWNERLKKVKSNVSKNWTISDLDKVTKTLKRNQTMDPNGMIWASFLL